MKLSHLFVTVLVLGAATSAFATVKIQKEAQAKNPSFKCATCHSAMPCKKENLTDEGKKWIPAAK